MSKKANTTLIGFFVIGAIVLIVLAMLAFSSRDYFGAKENFVLFFKGSVNGLSVGAPVKFKGVDVGVVKSISLHVNQRTLNFTIPVIIQFETNKIEYAYAKNKNEDEEDASARLHALIKKGLRAQLSIESVITGQQYVELDLEPNTLIRLEKNTTGYFQIPTVPSATEAIHEALTSARNAMDSIKEFFSAPELKQSIKSLNKTMENVNDQLDPVTIKLNETLDDLKDSMRSIRGLSNYLSRHPESVITGKGNR